MINDFSLSVLREEPRQINVILQQKLPPAKFNAVCTVYKQWLYVHWCPLVTTVASEPLLKHRIPFHISAIVLTSLNNYQYNCTNTISSVSVVVVLYKKVNQPINYIKIINICFNLALYYYNIKFYNCHTTS